MKANKAGTTTRSPLRRLQVSRSGAELTAAISTGGTLAPSVWALQALEAARIRSGRNSRCTNGRQRRQSSILAASSVNCVQKLDEWTNLLRRQTPEARQVLKKLLARPVRFTPVASDSSPHYAFATIALDQMLSGTVPATMLASPSGAAPRWYVVKFRRVLAA